jgi:hypothetical protein
MRFVVRLRALRLWLAVAQLAVSVVASAGEAALRRWMGAAVQVRVVPFRLLAARAGG